MTVPRDRVSFGSHAFPFTGLRDDDGALRTLPSLPIRLRQGGRTWSIPVDAVLDTGSTRTILPTEVADHLGIDRGTQVDEVGGAGAPFEAVDAVCDLAMVDALYPKVTCWEIAGAPVWVAVVAPSVNPYFPEQFDFSSSVALYRWQGTLASLTLRAWKRGPASG